MDSYLIEARFRDARIRADKDHDARTQLEQLSDATGLIAYLAAMSRAETARALEDASGARRWYERAAVLFPNAPAPRVGLAAFTGDAVPFDCVVVTEPVRAQL